MTTSIRAIPTLPSALDASVSVPGSKSIANRALVCAALGRGESMITNVPPGDDTIAMLGCLRALGVGIDIDEGAVTVGGPPAWPEHHTVLDAGLAGTTSRFVTALAALGHHRITIDGYPPLRQRPFQPLHDALRQLGAGVVCTQQPGGLPADVTGPPTGREVTMRGDVSSQYVSALMMIGPALREGLDLSLSTPLVSRPYVELTRSVMAWFGISGIEFDDRRVTVPAGEFEAAEVAVEPDASSASYPLAIAAVVGGSIKVAGLGSDALQGDMRVVDLLAEMGCEVAVGHDATTIIRPPQRAMKGIEVDMADISDLVPTIAVVAAFAETPTTIGGVGFIRGKESDRLGDLAAELGKAGVDVRETSDGLVIEPSADRVRPARLGTHHDHRLAMAFGVLGARVAGIEVEDPDVVTKSWPRYWDMLTSLA